MNKLLSISELIKLAKLRGINFGSGDYKIHLAYLAKLGLIPPAIKRKNTEGSLEGHYPYAVLDVLEEIEEMKKSGMSYADIKNYNKGTSSPVNFQQFTSNIQWPYYLALITLVAGVILGFILGRSGQSNQGVISTQQPVPVTSAGTIPISTLIENEDNGDNKEAKAIYLISVPATKYLNKIEGIQIK